LLAVLVALLLFGTQMPSAWQDVGVDLAGAVVGVAFSAVSAADCCTASSMLTGETIPPDSNRLSFG
jgi:hypothetical protein